MPTPPSPERRRYRGVIIGSGGIARAAHLPAFLEAPAVRERVEIVGLVDGARDVEPADGIRLLERQDQVMELGPVDFIDICTPTASHVPLTLWGLERGYHVLCEKPVALTRSEALRIGDAARQHGRVVVPCHQYRFNPVWRQIKDWLREGAIGHWHLAELSVHRLLADPGARAQGGGTPWRVTRDEGRGGVLVDHGTHLVYQALDVAGLPRAVSAWTGRLRHHRYEVEDTASVLLEYPDRLVTMFFTWAARSRENLVRFIGERGTIAWVGGELRLDADGRTERIDYSAQLDKASYQRWFAGLFATFVTAMDSGAADPYLQDIQRVAAVLEVAYQAAERGVRLRSEEHTSELQSLTNLVCRLLLEKKNNPGEDSRQSCNDETVISKGDMHPLDSESMQSRSTTYVSGGAHMRSPHCQERNRSDPYS